MPLLLRGLDLPDNDIRAGVIDTLQATATSDDQSKDSGVVSQHAVSLASTMLKNSLVTQMPSAVRVSLEPPWLKGAVVDEVNSCRKFVLQH